MSRATTDRADGARVTIAEQVRRAQIVARQVVLSSLDPDPRDRFVQDLVTDLIGHGGPRHISEDEFPLFCQALDAAYAVGIAVGLLLRAEAFANENGGAR